MNTANEIKEQLYNYCMTHINNRINNIEDILRSIKEAKNNETKSSAGDKYETSRAMMQIEENNNKNQLGQAHAIKAALLKINPKRQHQKVEVGSLVYTSNGIFFIGIGIGKVVLNEKVYYCISSQAPIGLAMMDKQKKDTLLFNGKKITVLDVF